MVSLSRGRWASACGRRCQSEGLGDTRHGQSTGKVGLSNSLDSPVAFPAAGQGGSAFGVVSASLHDLTFLRSYTFNGQQNPIRTRTTYEAPIENTYACLPKGHLMFSVEVVPQNGPLDR